MYQLDASLPPEAARAVDTFEPVVEVVVLWGDEVLAVEHVPQRSDLLPSDAIELVRKQCEAQWSTHRNVTYLVRTTHAARRVGHGMLRALEWGAQRWTLLSFAVHVGMLALFYALPPRSSALSNDLGYAAQRWVPIERIPTEIEIPEWKAPQGALGGTSAASSETQSRETGGDAQPAVRSKRAPERGKPTLLTHEDKVALAMRGGIAEVLRSGTLPAIADVFGAEQARARELGAELGEQLAIGGGVGGEIGRGVGIGRGPGGFGFGTADVGAIGTIGSGPGGDGPGRGRYGKGAGTIRGRDGIVPPRIVPKEPVIRGGLSKEVIRRTIHRHLAEVRHCYEQALIGAPNLQGRVTVSFVIGPDGAVKQAAIGNSDLGNTRVESCIAQAVQRWDFTAPEGGGVVVVSYPFVLSHVGS